MFYRSPAPPLREADYGLWTCYIAGLRDGAAAGAQAAAAAAEDDGAA